MNGGVLWRDFLFAPGAPDIRGRRCLGISFLLLQWWLGGCGLGAGLDLARIMKGRF